MAENKSNQTYNPNEFIREEFEEFIKNSSLSEEHKKKMLENAEKGVEIVEVKDLEYDWKTMFFSGLYYGLDKKIVLDDQAKLDIRIHEMMHAASTDTLFSRPLHVGLLYDDTGRALNEGMTEYLSDKVIRENGIEPEHTSYPELVSIVEDLNELYGEKVMIDSYLDSPAILEALMAKDGKCYTEFLEMTDDYYREVYNHKTLSPHLAKKEKESARLKYQKIGRFIEEIKEKRQKENPDNALNKSHWKDAYIKNFGGKEEDLQNLQELGLEEKSVKENSLKEIVTQKAEQLRNRGIAWFKNLKNKITEMFEKEDDETPLWLNEGSREMTKSELEEIFEIEDEEESKQREDSLQEEREEFLEHIRVDKSDLLEPAEAKKESQSKDITKDDEQMEL